MILRLHDAPQPAHIRTKQRAKLPTFQVGDRVIHLPTDAHGIVEEATTHRGSQLQFPTIRLLSPLWMTDVLNWPSGARVRVDRARLRHAPKSV